MAIGNRVQVQLIQYTVTKDANGRNQEAEGTKYGCWAEVSNPSGFRDVTAGITQLGQSKVFEIRFRFDKYPDVNWKIRYMGKDWTITSFDRVAEKRFYWRIGASSKENV